MKYLRFFEQDPSITWTKFYCPACGCASGKTSECYKIEPPKDRAFYQKFLGMVPLFTENCIFRADDLWQAKINYPVSRPLINTLRSVPGVEKIFAIKQYTLQISIAETYNTEEVKKNITRVYKEFIKKLSSIELDLLGDKYKPQLNNKIILGIKFPNGASFTSDTKDDAEINRQSIVLENLADCLPEIIEIRDTAV